MSQSIFGFPAIKAPLVDENKSITKHWYRMLVQMAGVLGTVVYGQNTLTHGTSLSVLVMKPGQSARVHAFSMAASANNASADAFYDGTTLTISNLLTNGSGVTLASSGANIQISNTAVSGSTTISWRVS